MDQGQSVNAKTTIKGLKKGLKRKQGGTELEVKSVESSNPPVAPIRNGMIRKQKTKMDQGQSVNAKTTIKGLKKGLKRKGRGTELEVKSVESSNPPVALIRNGMIRKQKTKMDLGQSVKAKTTIKGLKKGLKRKRGGTKLVVNSVESSNPPVASIRNSDDKIIKKANWVNKTRVLIFSSRGIGHRDRHLMEDVRRLMPHSKPDLKSAKNHLEDIGEIAEMKNCQKVFYFEPKKHKDLYLWVTDVNRGPSVKFLLQNLHTMNELKLTGNCLKGSRPFLTFDSNFKEPQWLLIKEILTQCFGIPKGHPKSQPFFDKVYTFSLVDNKIWFRNYQIVEEDGQLTEIGPRFVMNPIKIFDGSFGGATLWSNPNYVTPNNIRNMQKNAKKSKYVASVAQKIQKSKRYEDLSFVGDPSNDLFETEATVEPSTKIKALKKRKKRKINAES